MSVYSKTNESLKFVVSKDKSEYFLKSTKKGNLEAALKRIEDRKSNILKARRIDG
ncbi:hypothetical protein [Cetobacterium somerae]|uniref:hypothetical protein n=1 Tax=Cetobacterium somerae TaxID=188913 RepID=UPI003892C8C1